VPRSDRRRGGTNKKSAQKLTAKLLKDHPQDQLAHDVHNVEYRCCGSVARRQIHGRHSRLQRNERCGRGALHNWRLIPQRSQMTLHNPPRKDFDMRKLILALSVIAGVAVPMIAPAKADCRWEWNGNRMQQICR
jgi:hypothetical protein